MKQGSIKQNFVFKIVFKSFYLYKLVVIGEKGQKIPIGIYKNKKSFIYITDPDQKLKNIVFILYTSFLAARYI